MSYRKFYEQKTGVVVPSDFDVHHLDFDRENNHIKNLLALPREIHQKYHQYLMEYNMKLTLEIPNSIVGNSLYAEQFSMDKCNAFLEAKTQSYHWVIVKKFLLGSNLAEKMLRCDGYNLKNKENIYESCRN